MHVWFIERITESGGWKPLGSFYRTRDEARIYCACLRWMRFNVRVRKYVRV